MRRETQRREEEEEKKEEEREERNKVVAHLHGETCFMVLSCRDMIYSGRLNMRDTVRVNFSTIEYEIPQGRGSQS